MTVSNTVSKVTVSGNGAARVFSFSPMVIPDDSSQIQVWTVNAAGKETKRTEGSGFTNWSVNIPTNGYPSTGSITYPARGNARLAANEKIIIRRVLPFSQELELSSQGGYRPEALEQQLDRQVMLTQQLKESTDAVDSKLANAGSGTITEVEAGDGLSGGGTSGKVTLDVEDDGITPAMLDADTTQKKASFRTRLGVTAGTTTPDATESVKGKVQGATDAQSKATSGTTILGWSNNRIRALINAALPTTTATEITTGTSQARKVTTARILKSAINSLIEAILPMPNQAGKALKVNAAGDAYELGDVEASGDSNVQADWAETDSSEDSFIQNKPVITDTSKESVPIVYDPVGDPLTLADSSTATVDGPLMTDLVESLALKIRYTRTNEDEIMWTTLLKSDIVAAGDKLQLQGAGSAYLGFKLDTDKIVFENNSVASGAYTGDMTITVYNVYATGGEGGGNSFTIYTETATPTGSDGKAGDFWIVVAADEHTEIWENIEGVWLRISKGPAVGAVTVLENEVGDLQHLTKDIHAVDAQPTWEEAPDASIDLFATTTANNPVEFPPTDVTLTDANFNGNGPDITTGETAHVNNVIYARLPVNSARRNFRVVWEGVRTKGGNAWTPVTGPDEATYKYFYVELAGNAPNHRAHAQKFDSAEFTEFTGKLGGDTAKKLVPSGGSAGQVLGKKSGTNFDTEWVDGGTGGSGGDIGSAAYAYYASPDLTAPDVSTNQTIAVSNDGYKHTLLDAWTAPKGIVAGADFITEWEGVITFEANTACNMEIILRTSHTIGGNSFSHERKYFLDTPRNTRISLPMAVYNSRSRVNAGTFGGTTITAEDIAAAADITYELEFRSYNRKSNTTRLANTLKFLGSMSIETVSYQDGGSAGKQGAFYFRLYLVAAAKPAKPTAGEYNLEADTFSVTPNTWKIQAPAVPAGQRLWAIEAPIDPANDAGTTVDLTEADRWGAVFPVTGAKGDAGAGSSTDATARAAASQASRVAQNAQVNSVKALARLGTDYTELPATSNFDEHALIAANETIYEARDADENIANAFTGTVGREALHVGNEHWRGIANSHTPNGFRTDGGWTGNPDNAISFIMASDDGRLRLAMKRSVYETAKGSATSQSDKIAVSLTLESGNTDAAVLGYYSAYQSDTWYVIWQARDTNNNFNLFDETAGNAITALFFTANTAGTAATSTPLLTHAVSVRHWIEWEKATPDPTGKQALALATANAVRLDALDVQVGGVDPNQTVTLDASNVVLDRSNAAHNFRKTISNVQGDDLIVLEWKNFHAFQTWFEHILPGSSDTEGRMYFRVSNLGTAAISGQIGKSVGLNRRQSNNVNDPLASRSTVDMEHSGSNLIVDFFIDTLGSGNNFDMIPAANFELTISLYRNVSPGDVIGTIHDQIEEVKAIFGGVGAIAFHTQAEYDALTADDDTLYFVRAG